MLQFDPTNAKALYRRGVAYLNLKRVDDAITELLKASQLDPKGMHFDMIVQISFTCTNANHPTPPTHTYICAHTHTWNGHTSDAEHLAAWYMRTTVSCEVFSKFSVSLTPNTG